MLTAAMLLEAGAKIKDIQERLCHSKSSIPMDVYSHVTNTMSDKTVELFELTVNKNLPSS